MAYIYDIADTWNAIGTTFTAIKMNVTDTNSAAGSLLMDLQVGSASVFNVSKSGSLKLGLNTSGTNVAASNIIIGGSQGTGTGAGGGILFQVAPAGTTGAAQNALATVLTIQGNGDTRVAYDRALDGDGNWAFQGVFNGSLIMHAAYSLAWAPGGASKGASKTLTLFQDASNTLAQRNGGAAQTSRLYGTYTDGSNYRRLTQTMSTGGVAELKPEGAGTGISGNVLHISGLPTSNPGPGILWNNAGTPAIGT